MTNDAITSRLVHAADAINQKLDQLDMKCSRVIIKITEWGTDVELDMFNEKDVMSVKFDIMAGISSPHSPSEYKEEITIGS